MQAVYSDAACTIAATASHSSDQGLFFDRDPWLVQPRHLTVTWNGYAYRESELGLPPAGEFWCDHADLWMHCITLAPLNKRGWVAQESHLSRQIMHFAGNQVFWECRSCKASENYPDHLPVWAVADFRGLGSTSLKTRVHQLRYRGIDSPSIPKPNENLATQVLTADEIDALYYDWVEWKSQYSKSSFTKDGDKLIAIQGIAQDVGELFNDHLIAGMWKKRILEELCFRVLLDVELDGKHQRLTVRSWSWASTNQGIVPGEMTRMYLQYTYLTEVCEIVHESDDNMQTDTASSRTSLRVKSNLIQAKPTWVELPEEIQRIIQQNFGVTSGSFLKSFTFVQTHMLFQFEFDEGGVVLDDFLTDSKDRCEDIYILIIGYVKDGVFKENAACLLLAPHPVLDNHFERIGYLDIDDRLFEKFSVEFEKSEIRILTLV